MKCPTCGWALHETLRYGEHLYVHAFEMNEDGTPAGDLPPESCPYRGKMLWRSGDLFWPPQGYPGGDQTVTRRVDTGEIVHRGDKGRKR